MADQIIGKSIAMDWIEELILRLGAFRLEYKVKMQNTVIMKLRNLWKNWSIIQHCGRSNYRKVYSYGLNRRCLGYCMKRCKANEREKPKINTNVFHKFSMESKTKGNASTEIEKGIVISEVSVMTELSYCICLWFFSSP